MRKHAVLITGASTGIGACCAQRLSALGYRVFAGVRSDEAGETLRQNIPEGLQPVILDVTKPETIQSAFRLVSEQLSVLEVFSLVNNAGIAVGGPLEFLPLDALREQFEINVFGQIAVTQAFLAMLRNDAPDLGSRIVMMSSIAGRSPVPFVAPYSASKYALEAMSDALRVELSSRGIPVSVIEPGVIRTPIWQKSTRTAQMLADSYPPDALLHYGAVYDKLKGLLDEAERRGASPHRVADAVVHALQAKFPRTRYVVGQDARLRLFLNLLPDAWMDRLIRWRLGW